MNWRFWSKISLENPRIPNSDARRQQGTAAEILRRFDTRPGVILADEVGMGKTFVALAVAASAVRATNGERPVVVMVPASVQHKWPREWEVFHEECLKPSSADDFEIRVASETDNRWTPFLRRLDDPPERRSHIIFLTHGSLSNALADGFVKLALMREAMLHKRDLAAQRQVLPRWADRLLAEKYFKGERGSDFVETLMSTPLSDWNRVCGKVIGDELDDDPIPQAVIDVLSQRGMSRVDLSPLTKALRQLPLRESASIGQRLSDVRGAVGKAIQTTWTECCHRLDLGLPLLILDEAHHLKNPKTRFAKLFSDGKGEDDAEALTGAFAGVFDRMLFLTATPFQLGHRELVQVLRRFEAVRWPDEATRAEFVGEIDDLCITLDEAQAASLRLERAWGRLRFEDLAAIGAGDSAPEGGDAPAWWWADPAGRELSPVLRRAAERVDEVRDKMRTAQRSLRPWVIRHMRADKDGRRLYRPGAAIVDAEEGGRGGLQIGSDAVLPFLLAARAQGLVASQDVLTNSATRAYFAEGLSSSFEAYSETRRRFTEGEALVDEDAASEEPDDVGREVQWYLNRINEALPVAHDDAWAAHPKISATVEQALDLWRKREKVLIFCFYIATGRALRKHISRAISDELLGQAVAKLPEARGSHEEAREVMERFAGRFFAPDSPASRSARDCIGDAIGDVPLASREREDTQKVALRFLRTPSFLVRYVDLSQRDHSRAIAEAFDVHDVSGQTLRSRIRLFAEFVTSRVEGERNELLEALSKVQTGEILAAGLEDFDESELSKGGHGERREALLPNVRLVNGQAKQDMRRRLMLAFNTPFFPEVLIASSVLAEGVDLHIDCRHVIHHDLDWNPSVLEQRTGRLDRLGSKAERAGAGNPIVIFEPYLEATQDEKQFRVVKDRERWFNVVMGEQMRLNEWSTDRIAERVPFPLELAQELTMDLAVARPKGHARSAAALC